MKIKKITVIGSGTMGSGISQVFAFFGFEVTLCDVAENALAKGMTSIEFNLERMAKKNLINTDDIIRTKANITTKMSLEESVKDADLIVEAATENIEFKLDIFRQMDIYAPEHAILATNTSSISITKIASATKNPKRVIGMHFMNPVPVMKLVEIIRGFSTSDKVVSEIMSITKVLEKIPVEVNDYPGFVANRILMPMINEAIYTLYEGVAGIEEIDIVMKLGMAHPMGPLALADFIGLDVCLSILNIMYHGFGNQKYAPCPLLINMVTAGKLGRKNGEGFYIYPENSKEFIVSPNFKK